MNGDVLLQRLVRELKIPAPVVIVTAHPDDETVSLGGSLSLFTNATIVQVTDGAINDREAWTKAGVTTREEYRVLRSAERASALDCLQSTAQIVDCGITDAETVHHLPLLVLMMVRLLAEAQFVFTHPYEGGHVDHDSAAFVVQEACAQLSHPPTRLEFASYHWDGGTRRAGVFWPTPQSPTITAMLGVGRLIRKQAAVAAYRSQASVTRWFSSNRESYRIAPIYDFSIPPTTPACWYDRKVWKVTSSQWRDSAALATAVTT